MKTVTLGPIVVPLGDLAVMTGRRLPVGAWHVVEPDALVSYAEAINTASLPVPDIAPAGFVLALVPTLCHGQFEVTGARAVVNYGLERSRFPQQVRAGARLRAHTVLTTIAGRADGSVLLTRNVVVEIEGERDPACMADLLRMYLPEKDGAEAEPDRDDHNSPIGPKEGQAGV